MFQHVGDRICGLTERVDLVDDHLNLAGLEEFGEGMAAVSRIAESGKSNTTTRRLSAADDATVLPLPPRTSVSPSDRVVLFMLFYL